jgi:hypothetical protein
MEREARNPGFVPVARLAPHYAAAFAALRATLRRPLHAGYTLGQLIDCISN